MRPGLDLRLAGPVAAAWAALALLVGAPRAVAGWAGAAGLAAAGLLWRFGGQRRWVSPVALSLLVAGVFAAALAVQGGAWERSAVVRAAAQGGRAEVVLRLSEPAKARASPWGGDPSALARGVVWLLPAAAASAGSGAGAGAGAAAAGADSGAGGAVGAVGGSQAAGAVGAIRGPGVPALAYLEGEPPAAGAVAVFRGRLSLAQPADQERVVIEALEPAAVSAPTGWRGLVYRLRAGLLERASPLLAGITLGDTSGVEEELDAALKTTSLTHITAVSGAHVAIVLGLVLGLAA
ncbi:MAG: ComEC/Rec2 family competence protein, partial [Bifidobacteriaceae bacterium]|nr:ComEC/Rec2 family competence protein [Bifidobacteriaceae bacterium]